MCTQMKLIECCLKPYRTLWTTCICLAFGTGEGHLWYGICVPCSKRLPGVRDAFSEAFGVKNRRFRHGRDIRCQKQAPVVRDASSKARRTADSTDCGRPTAAPDASSVRETAPLGCEQK